MRCQGKQSKMMNGAYQLQSVTDTTLMGCHADMWLPPLPPTSMYYIERERKRKVANTLGAWQQSTGSDAGALDLKHAIESYLYFTDSRWMLLSTFKISTGSDEPSSLLGSNIPVKCNREKNLLIALKLNVARLYAEINVCRGIFKATYMI